MNDPLGAFVPGTDVAIAGAVEGPLAGLTFAAKDLFDVQGTVTGCGNPDWASSHPPAERSAWVVDRLLAAGASLAGKTITDEISLGLLGINRHHGTPSNPAAPDRVPGGSSSGSASAVAGGAVDSALGTDSGGSVRTPSSFCGLYGLRPTHGRIPVDGMATQSPSFDTAGFFARDAATFARVGEVLLDAVLPTVLPDTLLVADDCFAIADPEVREALLPALERVSARFGTVERIALAPQGLAEWTKRQGALQWHEFTRSFAAWIDAVNPRFSFEVASTLAQGRLVGDDELALARAFRARARARLDGLLEQRRVLCLPTVPILPIRRDASLSRMQHACTRILELTCIAGLTGLPQVNLPLGDHQGIPVGLSLIGWRGGDETLLALAGVLGG